VITVVYDIIDEKVINYNDATEIDY